VGIVGSFRVSPRAGWGLLRLGLRPTDSEGLKFRYSGPGPNARRRPGGATRRGAVTVVTLCTTPMPVIATGQRVSRYLDRDNAAVSRSHLLETVTVDHAVDLRKGLLVKLKLAWNRFLQTI
jgi:hypothetical protein